MSDTRVIAKDFVAFIHSEDFRSAIAGIMGQMPKGIERSKNLLIEFEKLESADREKMSAWCRLPSEKLPVTDQRRYVEEIARHEMAHIVVAKALGFCTGEATLVLYSPDGLHQGTANVILGCSTPSLKEAIDYLDHRVIILLAGYLAEPDDASKRKSDKYHRDIIRSITAESDMQKARELIQVKLNIQGNSDPNAADGMLYSGPRI